jgi:hypothetical protein
MNKNYQQTGGKRLKKVTWSPVAYEKHKPKFTKCPSSKRVLRKMKAA